MANQRRAGIIQLQVDGEILDCKTQPTYNLGRPVTETIIGADGVHGYKERPQIAFIEAAVTDRDDLDVAALVTGKNKTVTLSLANGKTVVLSDARYAGEGTVSAEEGEIPVRWEGAHAEEF